MKRWSQATIACMGAAEKIGGNENPELKVVRCQEERSSAIVFIHGFTGTPNTTWDTFVRTLYADSRLGGWDIYSVGYTSRFAVDVPVWTSDPKLDVCSIGMRTKLTHPPLDAYKAIAVVAHSMGGLVVQRAMLDDLQLRGRISHIVLYGCPSGGLKKARFGRLLKKQVADMAEGGKFIRTLRRDWEQIFPRSKPFAFKVVAGSEDSFVPADSSLMVFEDQHRAVVPGNHIEIVNPASVKSPSYEVLFKTLTNSGALRNSVESARLAVESREYESAVASLLPGVDHLDADAIVTLALALESLGRSDDAMKVVQNHVKRGRPTLDAIGVLAGRIKRRWLFARARVDYERSLQLYEEGHQRAVELDDKEQAYFHGINVAFLKLMKDPEHKDTSEETRAAASLARELAIDAPETSWSLATMAEASMILGNLKGGLTEYGAARRRAKTVRAQQSMFSQALQVASRVYGDVGESAVRDVFEGL